MRRTIERERVSGGEDAVLGVGKTWLCVATHGAGYIGA